MVKRRIQNSKNKNAGQQAPQRTKDRAHELFGELGAQWAEISRRLKAEGHDRCEPSTIRKWSVSGHWRALQLAAAEQPAKEAAIAAKTKPQNRPDSPRPATVATLQGHRERKADLEHVLDAIAEVVAAIGEARAERDYRPIGSLATALCKLIELKLKLSPQSAADLAERAVELQLTPEAFLDELAEAWRVKELA